MLGLFVLITILSFHSIVCLKEEIHSGKHHANHHNNNHETKFKKYIFVDVGGNIGDTVQNFLEHNVRSSPIPSKEYDSIYVFEPNKDFHKLYERFYNQSYSFQLIKAAATSVDGYLNFAGDGIGGSTLVQNSNNDNQNTPKVLVPSVDFSKWLKKTVDIDDYVVCKIDAEGSEYEIIQQMFVDGTTCLCDRLAIEWHGWLGKKVGDDYPHMIDFNDPTVYADIPGNQTYPCVDIDCVCLIPHLNLLLPNFYCTLPRMLVWVRSSCVGRGVRKDHLLENHDHDWFGR